MYDIFFIDNGTERSISYFKELKSQYPFLKRIKDYSNLYEAYLSAKEKSLTKMFWIIWPDIVISDDFKFDYEVLEWDTDYVHIFKNDETFDGLCIFSKNKTVSKKEIEHRFFIDKKEIDVIASRSINYDIFVVDSYEEYLEAMEKSTTELFWMTSRSIKPLDSFKFDLKFSFHDVYNRNENHAFLHVEDDTDTYRGLFLVSKNKPLTKNEVEFRHIVNRKEWPVKATCPKHYDIFVVDSYDEYLEAMEKATTELFWMTSRNIKIEDNFKFDLYFSLHNFYDRNENHVFIHRVNDKDYYNGVFLVSKNKPLTKKEVEFRHIVNRKEWPIVASGPVMYDKFIIDTYEDYLSALANSNTEMFWMIPKEATVLDDFKFDLYFTHDDEFNRTTNHVFKHKIREVEFNGVSLVTKSKILSKKEIDFRFLVDKKEHDILASTVSPYDIIFISYDEPNADLNFERLKNLYPNIKRIHGVKGIHQAHYEAAKLATTEMFWVIDGDAQVVDEFKFDYLVTRYETDIVHVWQSINPINGLIYGYGGAKLLPKNLTLSMDLNSTDMTTSISEKFKVMSSVSNITCFNTDPFNTWKSAFRECVKLSSGIIKNSDSDESLERLEIWCTKGNDKPFGQYAIDGAASGKEYGFKFSNENHALSLINDFDWLRDKFNNDCKFRH